jgi:asparagine synthase (glutamine-hydrolysing)
MCGIAGIVGIDACSAANRAALAAMTRALAPRGPDEESFWFAPAGDAALGFRRLAILDIDGGHQPAANEDGSVRVVFNGEIYNFQELHHRLEARGHRLTGKGDTAALAHLYEDDGEAMFERLRGMFAIAVWDEGRSRLILGRDRFGQKPLVWRIDSGGRLHFASELKALRAADPDWRPRVDPIALDQYLAVGYVPAPRTIYRGVFKLPAGHLATFEDGRIATKPYWRLDWSVTTDARSMPFDQAAARFRELLESAVAEQNVADVPVGVFLSGGVDSSIIAALTARLTDRPIRTFSVAFEDVAFDESPLAEAFAHTIGAEHTTIPVRYDAWETMLEVAGSYDEPLADNSALPTWLLARETARHVKVVLSGDGGDELALGYDRYKAIALAEKLRQVLPDPLRRFLSGPLARQIPQSARAKTRGRRIAAFLQSVNLSDVGLAARWLHHWDEPRRLALYGDRFLDELSAEASKSEESIDPLSLLTAAMASAQGRELVRQCQAADVAPGGYLPGDLMFKTDIASMAHSLECRAPFLDHRLAEMTAGLPLDYLIRPFTGQGKRIFRKACEDVVPDAVFRRRKMGFAAPVDRWLRGPLAQRTRDLLLSADACVLAFLDREAVSKTLDEHLSGRVDHAYRIWSLVALELWFRTHAPDGF